jgi:hypothetical protein
MPVPVENAGGGQHAGGYREHLSRAARVNFYLRILFSLFTLIHTGFGPGLLLRFPASGGDVAIEPLAQFYAFRPVIYALLFVAMVCVLAALCRRATILFEAEYAEDARESDSAEERGRYLRLLRPSPTPFVLSGNVAVDLTIFAAALLAYSFWVVVMAETAPPGLTGYQAAGIVLGSYGLFAALIIIGLSWFSAARRFRRLAGDGKQEEKPSVT